MKAKEIFTEKELQLITASNNWLGASIVLFDWVVIIGTFVLVSLYTNPLTILLGVFVLGARQLGLGVILHETGHRSFFTSQFWNDLVGNWLAGYWIFSDKDTYMRGHIKHHQNAGTKQDPDLNNYKSYPVPRSSLKRKFTRDLTGQLGWRRVRSIYRTMRRLNELPLATRQYFLRSVGANAVMLLILTLFGAPWLYLMWVAAFMTSHMLVTRIRQIAEHAAVPDAFNLDPRWNTRTLYINPLERFFIAPHQVNFHLEHHMLASVPIYRLETMHKILLEKGFYKDIEFQQGYFNLLRRVTYA